LRCHLTRTFILAPHVLAGILSLALSVTGAIVQAQNYPTKPIRFVTSEAGGGTDFAARTVAQGIAGPLGQPVIVDNRGSGGTISGEIVARANPDGYTILVTGGSFWVGPLLRKAPYDPIKDFTPVSLLMTSPYVLVVHPSMTVKSVKELIDLAKAKPGELNYAATSIGVSPHLAGELFKSMAGVNIVTIPYKGTGPGVIGLIGGQVQLMFAPVSAVMPHVKAGKLRALAVTSAQPSALAPGLPTIAATVPGYESGGPLSMFAPPKTPPAIISKLHGEVVKLLGDPEVKERLFNVGMDPVASSPQQLAATVKSEMTRLGKIFKDAGIRAE
jgi:tripartite-type tricarboxylate transporter receptor subunit TctC